MKPKLRIWFDGSIEYEEKFQAFLANFNLPTLSKYINWNFDGLSFKDIELDQFSIDDKQEEIKVIAVLKEDWSKLT